MPSNIHIHQIFYNEETRQQLDPGLIPLDNSANLRPDWYEFWPMHHWLTSHQLNENDWYGFLSPKFFRKTGFTSVDIANVIDQFREEANVVTFSVSWDQAAYFKNVFEQGETWHPGITQLTQQFLNSIGESINLTEMVNYANTAVFSNFIIAKPVFWKNWLRLADAFFAYAESNEPLKNQTTSYGSELNQASMKTFIQERFASIVLSQINFVTIPVDMSKHIPIFDRIFENTPVTKNSLTVCNLLKENYLKTGNTEFLKAFEQVKAQIKFKTSAHS